MWVFTYFYILCFTGLLGSSSSKPAMLLPLWLVLSRCYCCCYCSQLLLSMLLVVVAGEPSTVCLHDAFSVWPTLPSQRGVESSGYDSTLISSQWLHHFNGTTMSGPLVQILYIHIHIYIVIHFSTVHYSDNI